MLLPVLLFIAVGLAVGLVTTTTRVAAFCSLVVAAVSWVLIARFTYLQPIPVNEPEWWGGLAIVATLTGLGVALGRFMLRRRGRLLPRSQS